MTDIMIEIEADRVTGDAIDPKDQILLEYLRESHYNRGPIMGYWATGSEARREDGVLRFIRRTPKGQAK